MNFSLTSSPGSNSVAGFDTRVKTGDGVGDATSVSIVYNFDSPGSGSARRSPTPTFSPRRVKVFCSLSAGSLVGKNPAAQIWSPRNLGLCRRLRSGGTATQRTGGGCSLRAGSSCGKAAATGLQLPTEVQTLSGVRNTLCPALREHSRTNGRGAISNQPPMNATWTYDGETSDGPSVCIDGAAVSGGQGQPDLPSVTRRKTSAPYAGVAVFFLCLPSRRLEQSPPFSWGGRSLFFVLFLCFNSRLLDSHL